MEIAKVITVYAESTPNPAALKFVANKLLYNGSVEFLTREKALAASPFAAQLFDFSCVSAVFISNNFVTITKTPDTQWNDVMNIIREFVKNYVESGDAIILDVKPKDKTPIILSSEENTKLEEQIKEILDEYIRPAVEGDGGAIDLKSFENGVVTVSLRGACSGCPSSTVTLKAGIENLLKRMVPEVTEVVSEAL